MPFEESSQFVVVEVGRFLSTATLTRAKTGEFELRGSFPLASANSQVRILIGDDELPLVVLDSRVGWLRGRAPPGAATLAVNRAAAFASRRL